MRLSMRKTNGVRNTHVARSNIYYKNPSPYYLTIYRYAEHWVRRIAKCVIFYAVKPKPHVNSTQWNGEVAI